MPTAPLRVNSDGEVVHLKRKSVDAGTVLKDGTTADVPSEDAPDEYDGIKREGPMGVGSQVSRYSTFALNAFAA